MKIERIVLASASPRRKELLLQIGLVPEVVPSHVEERVTTDVLSRQKAEDVAAGCGAGTLVIGSDTVVAADGKILGKPASHEEAYEMVKSLAGRKHQVYTGVTMILKGESGEHGVTFSDETEVEVVPMTEAELREYAESEEPMDKAGAYAVQGCFARYIRCLHGSYANVMGLPVCRVWEEYRRLSEEAEYD